jgi:Transglycosylase SLT domain
VTPVLLRSAAGIIASASLALAVLTSSSADSSHAGQSPGPATGADRAAPSLVNNAASPAAASSPEPGAGTPGSSAADILGPAPSRLTVPDLVASVPSGLTAAQVAQIAALAGVRAVLPVDGGVVTTGGQSASLLGVSPLAFRSWAPPATADASGIWTALVSGDLVASQAAASGLALTPGTVAQLSGAASVPVIVAAKALLGLPGVDGVVNEQLAAQLGLVANVAVLINAPGADLSALMQQVLAVTGPAGHAVNLVPVVTTTQLPVTSAVTVGTPTNYLSLYQDSAAEYCPGLSWTVLAAIGQIESDHGANDGPSSAGALGPMQFLPSTWAIWGTDGFGQTGPPNIMNPLDAVPSAARMLCADGASAGGASLASAIYDYNHADWYVSEVLALASEYAQEYQ